MTHSNYAYNFAQVLAGVEKLLERQIPIEFQQ
jgi:hypothetical protein